MNSFKDKVKKYKSIFILIGVLFVLSVVLAVVFAMSRIHNTNSDGSYTTEWTTIGSNETSDKETDSENNTSEFMTEPTQESSEQENTSSDKQSESETPSDNTTATEVNTTKAPTTKPVVTEPQTTESATTEKPTDESSSATEPSNEFSTTTEPTTEAVKPEPTLDEQAEAILNGMTLEEKICQMFIITPEGLYKDDEKKWQIKEIDEDIKSRLQNYPVAGFVFFASNLDNPTQTKAMLSTLQEYAAARQGLTFFTCVDEEGGRVARIGNNANFGVKKVLAMNTITTPNAAYEAGYTIGDYLNELGFNFDFAPDADVITNSKNTVIGDRSFGTDADIVSEYAVQYAKGLSANNVLSTFKHFPGHGGTEGDTHEGFAYTSKTYDELLNDELKPFIAAKRNGVDAVMVAHISVPNILGDNTPCSLSYYMITEGLRNDIGYKGLIITDSLAMGAITQAYSNKEAAVLAVMAGNDLLLMPADFYEAYEGVLEAVKSGRISEQRINESVRRIIKVKLQLE